ncbi:uncharacterized protein L3040_007120 [Drepanopeziza brunnea f. sp. 'multigermtubi']|uniref:uncharacterized protein n=1 Tax=Drepanopeziza brunnea f. sp. 'multigermtubi' TaxID=698441 RepID=UPI00238C61D7|nr:hypothetical protein L3040_007120 [Drepanopeziza brunnea f. sp. 'multigermtubi']
MTTRLGASAAAAARAAASPVVRVIREGPFIGRIEELKVDAMKGDSENAILSSSAIASDRDIQLSGSSRGTGKGLFIPGSETLRVLASAENVRNQNQLLYERLGFDATRDVYHYLRAWLIECGAFGNRSLTQPGILSLIDQASSRISQPFSGMAFVLVLAATLDILKNGREGCLFGGKWSGPYFVEIHIECSGVSIQGGKFVSGREKFKVSFSVTISSSCWHFTKSSAPRITVKFATPIGQWHNIRQQPRILHDRHPSGNLKRES